MIYFISVYSQAITHNNFHKTKELRLQIYHSNQLRLEDNKKDSQLISDYPSNRTYQFVITKLSLI